MDKDDKKLSFSENLKKGAVKGLKQSTKYGAIGAIAGSVVPGIGTLAGGLAGVGIGTVVGLFEETDKEGSNDKD